MTLALTSYAGGGPNPQIGLALGGLLACGAVYALVGAVVHLVGSGWIERFMPPVVTGTVVAAIGLGLAAVPVKNMTTGPFDAWMQAVTFVCVALIAVFTGGLLRRLMILAGLLAASVIYAALANGLGLGKPIDLSAVAAAPWLGMPQWQHPVLSAKAALLYVPIVVVLVAENLGHLKAVAAMTGRNLDADTGKAFLADGLATMASAGMGGNGVTTYAENIGVMGATRIYSTAIFPVTATIAIVLGFSPKFGALLQAIPVPVIGGVSIVVFGLITVAGAKIWVDNRVDFTDIRNVLVAAIALTLGTGGFTLQFGDFTLEGIGTATFGAIALNWLLHRGAGTPARPPH